MSSELDNLQPKLVDEDGQFQTTTTKKAQYQRQRPQSEKKQRKRPKEDIPDMSIEDYVEALMREQKMRESRSEYGRALRCKRQLHLLKQEIQQRNMKIIRKKFREEEKEILRARKQELDEMDKVWADIIETYEQKCNAMIEAWQMRRNQDQKRLQELLEGFLSEEKTYSKDVVALKRAEQSLANKQQYDEAKKVHKSLLKIQKQLASKGRDELITKSRNLYTQMETKHQKEYSALMKRIMSGRDEQQLMYDKQQQKLEMKFENILRQHRRQQAAQLEKIDKYNRNQNVLNLSRLDASWIINNSNI